MIDTDTKRTVTKPCGFCGDPVVRKTTRSKGHFFCNLQHRIEWQRARSRETGRLPMIMGMLMEYPTPTLEAIGKRFGVTRQSVQQKLQANGLSITSFIRGRQAYAFRPTSLTVTKPCGFCDQPVTRLLSQLQAIERRRGKPNDNLFCNKAHQGNFTRGKPKPRNFTRRKRTGFRPTSLTVTKPCGFCDQPVTRLLSQLQTTERRTGKPINNFFCNKAHQGNFTRGKPNPRLSR